MTTLSYEERLAFFAEGKRLRRFRGYLRSPGDTTCDACGSSLPSYLHALRDVGASRDYFVGGNCFVRLWSPVWSSGRTCGRASPRRT